MITIFNRKLLLSTMNIDQYANAREDLAAAGIDYRVVTKGRNTKHTLARSYLGRNTNSVSGMIYDIYVHEKDHSKAVAVIYKKGDI